MTHHHHGIQRPFNDPERRQWQDPEAVLKGISLEPGNVFADIGCGGGFFALPAARMVGEKGKVYGVDISQSSISDLKTEADRQGLKNLYLTVGKAEESVPCRRCADIVFFGIALHDFQDPSRVLENAKIVIKPEGKLVNLDWKKDAPIGPPSHIRFDEAKAARLITEAGFKVEKIEDSGIYHYLIVAGLET